MTRIVLVLLLAGCGNAAPATDMADAHVDLATDMPYDLAAACSVARCVADVDCCPGYVCDQIATPGVCQEGVR